MSAPATSDDTFQTTGRFYAMVDSLHKFDELEVKGVIRTLLSTSERERCFIATYYRASGNVASLLELKQPRHFQAIAMLARSLFELAVDIKLIDLIPDSPMKIREFSDVEKLTVRLQNPAFQGGRSERCGRHNNLQLVRCKQ